MKKKKNQVIILDFGSQYTQLIARKVREQNVFCKILPHSTTAEELSQMAVGAVIISGGPASVYDPQAPQLDSAILNTGIPILGICYGMQLTAHLLDGHVRRIDGSAEYGKSNINILSKTDLLFQGLNEVEEVWMSHGDCVEQLPTGYQKIASSSSATAAAANQEKKIYLVQFHPEVKHTKNGEKILSNFLFKIANLTADWDMGSFIEQSINAIREQTAGKEVVCGISGGVDSSVLAVLLHKAIGDRLRCIFVDNGLLRKGERENIERRFRTFLI